MENLIYCLNATVPIFLMMALGFLLQKLKLIDNVFAGKINSFVFQISLPILLLKDMSGVDLAHAWDGKFVMFCLLATVASIFISAVASLWLTDSSERGEFVQASYRSSAALLGVALMENLYGSAGAVPLMIIGAVPLYNVAAVVVLTLLSPKQEKMGWPLIQKTLLGVLTNPILIGIVLGCIWSTLKIPMPIILKTFTSSIAATATPLGLIAMGASFDLKKATGSVRPALICSFFKLVVFTAIFLPMATIMGFREDKLVAILVMLGAATTVSCYIMARNLGHAGILTANAVMITTMFSAFTLTGWMYLVRILGLI